MGCLFFYFLFLALMNDKLQNICSGMLCHVRVFVSVHAASCYAPITIAAQSHPGWTDYPICVDRIDLQDIFIHLTIYSVKASLVLECLHEISQLVFPLPLQGPTPYPSLSLLLCSALSPYLTFRRSYSASLSFAFSAAAAPKCY